MSDGTAQKALQALRHLQEKIARLERGRMRPAAIVGIGCRLPGGVETPEALWEALMGGRDFIGPMPADRWDLARFYDPDPAAEGRMYVREGGFLDDIERFDADFFHISPREARAMDPQQRILLEVVHEAFEEAAIDPAALRGAKVGVFIGGATTDYAQRRAANLDPESVDPYHVSGTVLSVLSGRIAYQMGFTGPALTVDTACSSSLTALDLAVEALSSRGLEMAVVGGVAVMTAPEPYISFCKAGMLSPGGRCRTFDRGADGYVRSEGCGVILLKSLEAALRDNDTIHAVVVGTGVNQDGPSGGLTVPNGPAQEEVIGLALARADLTPDRIDCVECHGTATPLGDPIEVNALGRVFFSGAHGRTRPLALGSVKTNLGHTEAAAGILGVIKMALQLSHRTLAPHLHLTAPSPYIKWEKYDFAIPTAPMPLTGETLHGGVSSFGFCGTNAHAILQSPPPREPAAPARRATPPRTVFARTPHGVADRRPAPPRKTPFPGRRVALPFDAQARFAAEVGGGFPPYLADHRLFGRVVLAGASHLSMLIEGALAAWGGGRVTLADVEMAAPLVAAPVPGGAKEVQLIYGAPDPGAAGARTVRLVSRAGGEEWTTHVRGVLRGDEAPAPSAIKAPGALPLVMEGEKLYGIIAARGHHLGESYRLVRAVTGEGALLVSEIDPARAPLGDYALYSGLIDAALQAVCVVGPRLVHRREAEGAIFVPHLLGALHFHARPAPDAPLRAIARVRAGGGEHALGADIDLVAGDGRMILQLRGLVVSRLSSEDLGDTAGSATAALCRRLRWEAIQPPAEAPPPVGAWGVEPGGDGEVAAFVGAPRAGAENLLDLRFAAGVGPEEALEAAEALLSTLQGLAGGMVRRYVLVTRGAMTPPSGGGAGDPHGAVLWGMARAARHELPGVALELVDLDADGGLEMLPPALAAAHAAGEVAVRGGGLIVPRLVTVPVGSGGEARGFRGTALVTGGCGALGLRVARLLAKMGCPRILLAGRTVPTPAVRAAMAGIAAQHGGCEVTHAPLDVTDLDAVRALFSRSEGALPITSVFHGAGVLDDGALGALDRSRLALVFAPKVAGAWNLHRATVDRTLDHFVLFSSTSALFGHGGQVNYAGANAFLDGLAAHRVGLGLPALSVNWGGWRGLGLAAGIDGRGARALAARGLCLLEEGEALDLLASHLSAKGGGAPLGQVMIAALDSGRFGAAQPPAAARMVTGKASPAAPASASTDFSRLGPGPRRRGLEALVREVVAGVLAHPDPGGLPLDKGFFEMGVDSISANTIRAKLGAATGLALPVTLIFDHPTPAALVAHLDGLAANGGGAGPADADRRAPGDRERSPALALAEVDARLDELEGWLADG